VRNLFGFANGTICPFGLFRGTVKRFSSGALPDGLASHPHRRISDLISEQCVTEAYIKQNGSWLASLDNNHFTDGINGLSLSAPTG
jgi:hypothetical protein